MAEIGQDIQRAKYLLEQGELVAIPTETVYGLAGNALNPDAIAKIFTVKNRPYFDPLIVHVFDFNSMAPYVYEIPDSARHLAEEFWPGPLTLLLKKKNIIPDLVTSGLNRVGIRCPDHALTLELLQILPFPLAAPSANPFGYVSPTKPQHVNDQLGEKISYILDGGPCQVGVESTIIGFDSVSPVIYRIGGCEVEEIERVVGKVSVQIHSSSNPNTPGQLVSHYAPGKKLILGEIEELLQRHPSHRSGILTFQKNFNSPYQIILSSNGSLKEAAQNLFSALRAFDKMPIDFILAELVPDEGLGMAINDRLRRAAASTKLS